MKLAATLAAAALLAACAAAPPPGETAPPAVPELASGIQPKPGWAAEQFAVAAAHPLAADAGYRMLRAGGSAIDAAVAVQMVLTLVEPQSSGIGGGAVLLHHDGTALEAYDGRETAPAGVDEQLLLAADGRPLAFQQAVVGGRAVGVPGAVRMLELAHRRHGKLAWARLFEPAIQLAEEGFGISPRLHALLKADAHLKKDPVAAAYFYRPGGEPHEIGFRLRNPDLAAVLRRIAAEGSSALHQGPVAQAIVAKVRQHPTNPGRMAASDLADYRPKLRSPICHDHRARGRDWRICGFPPPGSGAIAIGQIVGILSQARADALPLENGRPGAQWLHLYLEAARLAFADRAQYVADPDFVAPPGGEWMSLLDPGYLRQRAALIGEESLRVAKPGVPAPAGTSHAPSAEQMEVGTSHVSIVDAHGQAVEMTTTIEDQFGARQMVSVSGAPGGFLLNNQLTDFSFAPADAAGTPIANRVQPGKRPRTSMAPTMVFDRSTGARVLGLGSPGGGMIIHFTAKTLYGMLHWGLDAQRAIDLPNFGSLNGPSILEQGGFPARTVEALRRRGAEVHEQPLTSGVHAIQRTTSGFFGGADPRREGVVRGD